MTMSRDTAARTMRAMAGNGNAAIWVTDAVLVEELIAGADKLGVRRFAFWRLGQEDPAIWGRLAGR
jgi:spore germination protein YaaH